MDSVVKKGSTMKKVTFNPLKPDKKFVRQVLWQAFTWNDGKLKEIYSEARCLQDMDLENWEKLKKYLIDEKLVEESMEEEYFYLTQKGSDLFN